MAVGCLHVVEPSMVPDKIDTYQTVDGWSNAIRHYQGDGPPVVLVHGVATNHYCFDFAEEVSLAHYLVERGFDVWVPALRGDDDATPPYPWLESLYSFDDRARFDVPAFIDHVLIATGESELYWVGHSMGGMLLFTALGERDQTIKAGVGIAATVDFSERSRLAEGSKRIGWSGRHNVPAPQLARGAESIGLKNLVLRLLAVPGNIPDQLIPGLIEYALTDVSGQTAHQLIEWMHYEALVDNVGEFWWRQSETPLLLMSASQDLLVAPVGVQATCDMYIDCTYSPLGIAHGNSVDFGHVDVLLSTPAAQEVFPLVADFLEEHAD